MWTTAWFQSTYFMLPDYSKLTNNNYSLEKWFPADCSLLFDSAVGHSHKKKDLRQSFCGILDVTWPWTVRRWIIRTARSRSGHVTAGASRQVSVSHGQRTISSTLPCLGLVAGGQRALVALHVNPPIDLGVHHLWPIGGVVKPSARCSSSENVWRAIKTRHKKIRTVPVPAPPGICLLSWSIFIFTYLLIFFLFIYFFWWFGVWSGKAFFRLLSYFYVFLCLFVKSKC